MTLAVQRHVADMQRRLDRLQAARTKRLPENPTVVVWTSEQKITWCYDKTGVLAGQLGWNPAADQENWDSDRADRVLAALERAASGYFGLWITSNEVLQGYMRWVNVNGGGWQMDGRDYRTPLPSVRVPREVRPKGRLDRLQPALVRGRKDRVTQTFEDLYVAVEEAIRLLSQMEAAPAATSDQRAMGERLMRQLKELRVTLQMVMQSYRSAGAPRSFLSRKQNGETFDALVREGIDALALGSDKVSAASRIVPNGAPSGTGAELYRLSERVAELRGAIFNVLARATRLNTSRLGAYRKKQTPSGAFSDWWSASGQYDAQRICRESPSPELHQPGVLADIRRWCEQAFVLGAANEPHTTATVGTWPDPALDDLEEDAYQAGRRFASLPPYA